MIFKKAKDFSGRGQFLLFWQGVRWGGGEVLPAKERISEEGRHGVDRSWGIWSWVGQAMSKVMAGATMQRQR